MAEITIATTADLKAIDSLQRREVEAVGFLPACRYEAEIENNRRTLLIMRENNDPVGFLFWTRGWPVATIQQIVIRDDARRKERATALVEAAAAEMVNRYGITLRCRANLEAVDFWKAIGFEAIRQEEAGRRNIPLWRFYRALQPSLLLPKDFVRGMKLRGGQRYGFRTTPDG